MPATYSRRAPALLGLATLLLLAACANRTPPLRVSPPPDLERDLRALIAEVATGEIAVAVRDLGNGWSLSIDGDRVMHAASTMKLPVLIEYMRRIDRAEIADSATVLLQNSFRSSADRSLFTLDPGDDSDSTVYGRVGQQVPLRWLATRMITHSSNLATNVLIDRLGPAAITRTSHTLGARRTEVRRGVEDNIAFRAGIINETTADDLAAIMSAIATDRAASAASCRAMRDILLAQAFNDGIPALLPPTARVAHKTGEITATHHDAAIVYPATGAPYVLVVLTRAIPDRAVAVGLTARIARSVHHALRE
jgi:beta-lactamase class A